MERHRASISLTYDLFGTAKTALKFSAGKYHKKMETLGMVRVYNLAGGTDRRNWFDCDLIPGTSTCSGAALPTNSDDIAQENEIGPSSNLKFVLAPSRRADPNLKREYNWDYTVSIQHELLPRVSVNAAWYYSKFYNLPSTRNVLLTPSDYTSFQLASPLDNGEPITVFNLNREKLGLVDDVTVTSNINRQMYHGFEVSIQGRLPNGATLLGGWFPERSLAVRP